MGKYACMEIFMYFRCARINMEIRGNFLILCSHTHLFLHEVIWFKELHMYHNCLYA